MDILIEVFRALPKNQQLYVCPSFCKFRFNEEELPSNVFVLPQQPYPDVVELYNMVSAVIFSYRYPEPIGRTLIEALQFGKLVIASGYDEMSPIIKHMKHGILVWPPTAKNFYYAIKKIIDNPKLVEKLRENGRKQVFKICNANRIVNEYLQIYREIA